LASEWRRCQPDVAPALKLIASRTDAAEPTLVLNDTFRRERLLQRLAALQAATWLIDVLEKLATLA
jgi:hypothetical protein